MPSVGNQTGDEIDGKVGRAAVTDAGCLWSSSNRTSSDSREPSPPRQDHRLVLKRPRRPGHTYRGQWRSADFEMGDALIFGIHTMLGSPSSTPPAPASPSPRATSAS